MSTRAGGATLDMVAIVGLVAGAVFGIAGTLVSQASLRQTVPFSGMQIARRE